MQTWDSALCILVSYTSQYSLIRDWFCVVSHLRDGIFWYALMLCIANVGHLADKKQMVLNRFDHTSGWPHWHAVL